MALLRKLFSVTLTYFLKVKDLRPFHNGKQPFRCDMCEYTFESRPSQGGEHPFLSKVQMITVVRELTVTGIGRFIGVRRQII